MATTEEQMVNKSPKERAFWAWWEDVEPYQHLYSLRMAFDAGYNAAKESDNGQFRIYESGRRLGEVSK